MSRLGARSARADARLRTSSGINLIVPLSFQGDVPGCVDAPLWCWARIIVQVTIHRRLLVGRDGRLDQSEAYDVS